MPEPSSLSPSDERTVYSAPALEKGLAILELLAEAGEPLSTRAIAERLGRSKNEIFRMVFVLVEHGYLAREVGTDRLLLTNRLFELGMRTPRPRQLVEVAVPAMERLSDETGQSAHLVVLNRGETVVVAATTGGADLNLVLSLGYRRPAIDATSGLLILAFQPDRTKTRLVTESAKVVGVAPDQVKFDALLAGIRERGYHVAESRDVVGVTDIGCPIVRADGRAVASIVVPYLNRHRTPSQHDQVLRRLQQVCEEISDQLM